MDKMLQKKTGEYIEEHGRKKNWRKVVTALSAVVVFCTTYALIMPAVTQQASTYCGFEEHAVHTDECYWQTQEVICAESEEGHVHSQECFEVQNVFLCDKVETDGHAHSADCFAKEETLMCENTDPEHVHNDACYMISDVLVCEEQEAAPHYHDAGCVVMEQVCICELSEQPEHKHRDTCFENVIHKENLICELPIHEHSLQCFSNPEADLESAYVWEKSFAYVEITGNWRADVVSIAETQLGYSESTANYEVQDDGVTMKGYTRYGDWYGIPYGDWCAMFCSFCLNYAGVDYTMLPFSAGCQTWIQALRQEEYDLYRPAESGYVPCAGDLIFFDVDTFDYAHPENRSSDHVGLVYEVKLAENGMPKQVVTIEGNYADRVQRNTYDIADKNIMGYGELPDNPNEITKKTVFLENGIVVSVSAPNSSYIYPADSIQLSAGMIYDDSAEKILQENLEEQGVTLYETILVDVSLVHEGVQIEPCGPVKLSFDTGIVLDASAVYHVDETNETITDMSAEIDENDGTITIETDHFSVFALTADTGKAVTAEVTATWDQENRRLVSVSAVAQATSDGYFSIDWYDSDNWARASAWSDKTRKNTEIALVVIDHIENAAPENRFRVHFNTSNTEPENTANAGYSTSFDVYDLLNREKPGFTEWLSHKGIEPESIADLYAAFGEYYALPVAVIASEMENGQMYLDVSLSASGYYTYAWQYQDDNGDWQSLVNESSVRVNASECEALLDGGRDVRCIIYDAQGQEITISEAVFVNPMREIYDAAIEEINLGLDLSHYSVMVGGNSKAGNTAKMIQADLSIHGTKYDNYFYWTNLANDNRVPFSDGESYADYLASVYLSYDVPAEGLAAVRGIWDKYIFDMYDPSSEGSWMSNITTYPDDTYGDQNPDFVKDQNSSSFHGLLSTHPVINELDYDYLEDGIDYANFVSGLEKSAESVAPGDANSERKYLVNITADAQAKAAAPVAMIVQIQTSWQLFDLLHANAQSGQGETQVGSVAYNTELANLYDIKQALLRFVDYMETKYPGNNLVLGITETRHAASQTMFLGTDSRGGKLYVTNDYDTLREGIQMWDTFGNCEHVHYDTDTLTAAVTALPSNLSSWHDFYGHELAYSDIQKVAVIIGGPTENTSSTNGYGCTLPWSTFTSNGINSVYGIRVNEGIPVGNAPVISWIDYSGNNSGSPYSNGGSCFTDKYVATTEDAVLNALINIAESEMLGHGLDIEAADKYVEDLVVDDTVTDEFRIDPSAPFVATVYNSEKYGGANERGKKAYESVINWQTGEVLQYSYTSGVAGAPVAISGERTVTHDGQGGTVTTITFADRQNGEPHVLSVAENADGTSYVSYVFGKVYNTKKCNLNFEVIAEDDYIGSNSVYTNVGTPGLDYTHHVISSDGAETGAVDTYTRNCNDTPQVNVPIRFNVTDGGYKKSLVNVPVDLGMDEVLNSHVICENIEDLVDNYDQINGIVSYAWILPDGTEVECGRVPVKNGAVQGDFPALDYNYPVISAGLKTCTLNVSFIPEDIDPDNRNFKQDGTTPVPVNRKTLPGHVWIEAVEADRGLNYYARKVWDGTPATDRITFRLADGYGGYISGDEASGWSITDNADDAYLFSISSKEEWQIRIKDLPSVKTGYDGQSIILEYEPEEFNIPEGYQAVYSATMQTDKTWAGKLNVTVTNNTGSSVDAKNAKNLHMVFEYNGETFTKDFPVALAENIAKNGGSVTLDNIMELPLDENNAPISSVTVIEAFFYKDNYGQNKVTVSAAASLVPTETGEESAPVLVITNMPAATALTIRKSVVGVATTQKFTFTATLSKGEFMTLDNDSVYTLENGAAHFNLSDGEAITLHVPMGAEIIITETENDGFYPIIKKNNAIVSNGNTAVISVDAQDITVLVENTTGYELPHTGGIGSTVFYVVAVFLAGGALVILKSRRLACR